MTSVRSYILRFALALAILPGCIKKDPEPPKETEDPTIFPDLKGPDCSLIEQKALYSNKYYYDTEHKLTAIVYQSGSMIVDSGTVTYSSGRISRIAFVDKDGKQRRYLTYRYDNEGRLQQYIEYWMNYKNGQEPTATFTYEYKGSNLPQKIIVDLGEGTDYESRPDYDDRGNRIREIQVSLADGSTIRTIFYSYDTKPNYRRSASFPGSVTWFNRNNIEKENWSSRGYEENTINSTYQYNDKDLVVKENYFNRSQETTRTYINSYECWK